LHIKQLAKLNQSGEGDTRLGCVAQSAASNGVEHPGGDDERWAVSKPDEVMVSSQSPETADEGDLLAV
jgi:hypothetical protein